MAKENIEKKILEYLESIPFSATTEMVAKATKVNWYTAQMHLYNLERKGLVKYFKIGRQNQWILAKKLKD